MFRITARTVLELGAELISSDIIAFYELVKNGFDAGTTDGVEIRFDIPLSRRDYLRLRQAIAAGGSVDEVKELIVDSIQPGASDSAREGIAATIAAVTDHGDLVKALDEIWVTFNTISVSDSGSGMSLADLEENFLVIGTASRKREVEAALTAGHDRVPFLGEKGIGRLSAMRLGERLRVETARADDLHMNCLDIDWAEFGDIDAMLDQIPVAPKLGGEKPDPGWSGTSITISDLSENWTFERVRDMCRTEFSRLTDPFADAASRPRVAVYWNGERQSVPIMPSSLLEAAHARVVGRYEIIDGKPLLTTTVDVFDLGFEHPRETETLSLDANDMQGTFLDRDGLVEESALKTIGPFTFEAHWFNRRRLSRVDATGDNRAVRELQADWSGILLFRDGFRVFPYGEDEDDWLELDRRALGRSGYALNKTQFIGRVNLTRVGNSQLVDQTNREGLRVTPEQQLLLRVIRFAIQDRLGDFMREVEREYKEQKVDLSDSKSRVSEMEKRARRAIRQLRKMTPKDGQETIDELQQTLLEFSDVAAQARRRIDEVEKESRQMVEMAGVGLMVEVVAHELARASENALKALDRLQGREVPDALRAHLATLKAEMKSISKRVRILDPMSVAGRQRQEAFAIDGLLRDTIEAHEAQFERHGVTVRLEVPKRPMMVRAVKGMIVQILENLISNSLYWIEIRSERDLQYRPEILITLEGDPPTITFEDNGRGIAPTNRDKVFRPFFSLKEPKKRRGLGLYIARDAAEHHGGTLELSDQVNPETGRLHRFVLELPDGAQK